MNSGRAPLGGVYGCRVGAAYSDECVNDFARARSYDSWTVLELEFWV